MWHSAHWFASQLYSESSANAEQLRRMAAIKSRLEAEAKQPSTQDATRIKREMALKLERMEEAYKFVSEDIQNGVKGTAWRVADRLTTQLSDTASPFVRSLVLRLYLLEPGDKKQFQSLVTRADATAKSYKSRFADHYIRGAILYRSEEYQAALHELLEGEKYEKESNSHAVSWLFLAMTYAQLDQSEESKKWLDAANSWMANNRISFDKNIEYQSRISFLVLRKEAEDVVNSKRTTTSTQESNIAPKSLSSEGSIAK